MKISAFNASYTEEITRLFSNVFSDSEGQEEGHLIGSLVADLVASTDSQDIYGFVASENDQIIGSIFFTRLTFDSPINAFILSPVAIHTDYQSKGIGQRCQFAMLARPSKLWPRQ